MKPPEFSRPQGPSAKKPASPKLCKFLRSKEMYYETPGQQPDGFLNASFWCLKSQESFGPDGKPAEAAECCEGRPCFKQ